MLGKVVLAGGGTAGHVNPLLATATVLAKRGYDVEVLGTAQGLESDLVPSAGFPLHVIEKVPFPRRPSLSVFTFPFRWRKAVNQCRLAIRDADVVVGFGGYVSTPAYRVARGAGVPIVIHEQNARPGLANKVGARYANVLALTFANTPLNARKGITQVTGLPLRPAIEELALARQDTDGARVARERGAKNLGVDPEKTTLLVTGGSLGALHLNDAMIGALGDLPDNVQVIHLTGKGKDAPVWSKVEKCSVGDRYLVLDYLTTMEDALACADLVVCRSGAGTVAEMTALSLPCVYVPLAIGNGEQKLNAHDHVASGGALLVDDASFNADTVRQKVFPLLTSPELSAMATASAGLAKIDAASRLADLVVSQIAR